MSSEAFLILLAVLFGAVALTIQSCHEHEADFDHVWQSAGEP